MNAHGKTHSIFTGLPCASSYWVSATREQLAALVAARRHQQGIPSSNHVAYDPALAATAALGDHQRRARLAARRRGTR